MADDTQQTHAVVPRPTHIWDDDGCCERCGFDGAEWSFWKNHTYEGKASDERIPPCGGYLSTTA